MKKIFKKKNIYKKSVNNHKIKIYHKNQDKRHIVSKGLKDIYKSLSSVYREIDDDYMSVDLIDLIYYERWLNE